jgi:hypothetical protein
MILEHLKLTKFILSYDFRNLVEVAICTTGLSPRQNATTTTGMTHEGYLGYTPKSATHFWLRKLYIICALLNGGLPSFPGSEEATLQAIDQSEQWIGTGFAIRGHWRIRGSWGVILLRGYARSVSPFSHHEAVLCHSEASPNERP